MKYKHKKTGKIYEPKKYEGGYRIVIEFSLLNEFERFSKIAHGARMVEVGSSDAQGNVLSFSELDRLP